MSSYLSFGTTRIKLLTFWLTEKTHGFYIYADSDIPRVSEVQRAEFQSGFCPLLS